MTHAQTLGNGLRIMLVLSLVAISLPCAATHADAKLAGDAAENNEASDNSREGGGPAESVDVPFADADSGGEASREKQTDGGSGAVASGAPSGDEVAPLLSPVPGDAQAQPATGEPAAADALAPTDVHVDDSGLAAELDTHIRDFESARDLYAKENEALQKMQDERAVVVSNIEKFRDEVERAQTVKDAAIEELERFEGGGFAEFIARLFKPDDYESQLHLLHKIVDGRDDVIVSSNAAKSGLERKKEELDELMGAQGEQRRLALERVNSRACEMEVCCSKLHQSIKDANGIVGDGQVSGGAQVAGSANIVQAESMLMQWYNETNALSGTRGGLSFGEGADFSMSQSFFVEKWGSAIDAYFEKRDTEPGVSPLKGMGKTMATSAYKYRIDPRLCAAVSVAESSGGRHCIKPHNAWGWGAVDSDPYGGASSWSSWEEAIEAWHKGMAESKTGLANARTVSILANVYCSSPIWGATVAGVINEISAQTIPELAIGNI